MPSRAAAFLAAAIVATGAEATECGDYHRGDMKTADLTIFANLDEYDLGYPPRVQRINYGRDYLTTIHIPGWPGFPYEVSMTFRFEKDTGRPTAAEAGNEREIQVNIRGGWTTVEENLPNALLIGPGNDLTSIDWTARPDALTGMEVMSINPVGRDGIEAWFDEKNEVYISRDEETITSFMTCHKPGAYRVPHCQLSFSVAPLTARVRFQRHLLTDFANVREQAERYVACLMDGETRIPSTIPSDR